MSDHNRQCCMNATAIWWERRSVSANPSGAGWHSNAFPTIEKDNIMQSASERSPDVAQAILDANSAVANLADPKAVRRLEVDPNGGQLWVLNTAMNVCRGDGGANPSDFECVAVGYTALGTVNAWLPVRAGHGNTVAEVLAQLTDDLRGQVVGVQFLDRVVEGLLNPTEPAEENEFLEGWALIQTCLYRLSRPVNHETEQPFALSDSAFDETGAAHLILQGCRYDTQWNVIVHVYHPSEGVGEVIGVIMTEEATHPGASGDVMEATRQWIVAQLPAGTREGYYRCLNHTYGRYEQDLLAGGRMTLLRDAPHNA